MTSYQKKINEIKYWKQRGEDLETIIDSLLGQMKESKIHPRFGMGRNCSGDRFINDISSGEFAMKLSTKYANL